MKKSGQIHIRLSIDTIALLEINSGEMGLTVSQYIKHLILKNIEPKLKAKKASRSSESR